MCATIIVSVAVPVIVAGADDEKNVVTPVPSPETWLEAAQTGDPLHVTVEGRNLPLVLAENTDLFADGSEAHDATGAPIDMDEIHPLEGTVQGIPGSFVAATVADEMILATAYVPGIGEFHVGPLKASGNGLVAATDLDEPARPFEPPGTTIGTGELINGHMLLRCLNAVPHHLGNPTGLALGFTPARDYEVDFAVDDDFVAVYGASWSSVATSFINAADVFYSASTNVGIVALGLHSHGSSPDPFPGPTTGDHLDQLETHYNTAHSGLSREGSHLFTGMNLAGAIGQANCIGGAGDPFVAYTVSMGAHLNQFSIFVFNFLTGAHVKVLAHEIGHILSAHHHYANCVEATTVYNPLAPIEACTLMINFVDMSTMKFSTVNTLATRGWADHAGL